MAAVPRRGPATQPWCYLAAGNVQGLRPLRYEKRVARNRFLMLLAAFIVILYGLIYWYRNFL
ncbi:MAG: hypothetical protein HS113_12725 [Verrucomicrobiales bacterium]|nr:hypothetical protein [Verrucomicrobiales bacterium]